MPGTYEPISTITLGSATSGLIFDNISQAYTDLVMVFKGNITTDFWDMAMRFNNNSSNYSNITFAAQAATIDTAKTSTSFIAIGGVSGWRSTGIFNIAYVHIYNYTNTNINKVVTTTNGTPNYANGTSTSTWANTSAITSIYLWGRFGANDFNNLAAGSQITLYGIKAA